MLGVHVVPLLKHLWVAVVCHPAIVVPAASALLTSHLDKLLEDCSFLNSFSVLYRVPYVVTSIFPVLIATLLYESHALLWLLLLLLLLSLWLFVVKKIWYPVRTPPSSSYISYRYFRAFLAAPPPLPPSRPACTNLITHTPLLSLGSAALIFYRMGYFVGSFLHSSNTRKFCNCFLQTLKNILFFLTPAVTGIRRASPFILIVVAQRRT